VLLPNRTLKPVSLVSRFRVLDPIRAVICLLTDYRHGVARIEGSTQDRVDGGDEIWGSDRSFATIPTKITV
jgi:hypothetical protein